MSFVEQKATAGSVEDGLEVLLLTHSLDLRAQQVSVLAEISLDRARHASHLVSALVTVVVIRIVLVKVDNRGFWVPLWLVSHICLLLIQSKRLLHCEHLLIEAQPLRFLFLVR